MKLYYLVLIILSLVISVYTLTQNVSNEKTIFLSHNGIERRTIMNIHEASNEDELPLVLVFHGFLGNSEYTLKTYGFTEFSNEEHFIIAYPEGTGELNNLLLSWNAGFCCGYAQENEIDDVGYIVKLLTVIKEKYAIDEKRIYLVGFSNGGMITYKLISEHPELFMGAAIISSTPSGGKNEESLVHIKPPEIAVPLLIFHGELDTIIPYYGGYSGEENETGIYFPSIPESVEYWANSMGADSVKEISLEDGSVIFRKYFDIAGRPIIEFYTLTNDGHTIPGRVKGVQSILNKDESTINAKEIIWDFFDRIGTERFK